MFRDRPAVVTYLSASDAAGVVAGFEAVTRLRYLQQLDRRLGVSVDSALEQMFE
jgi:hypothetical protein